MCLFWKKIPIWRLKERCSPYHLQIRLDCFRAGTDQIHCERNVIIITIVIIKFITRLKTRLLGWSSDCKKIVAQTGSSVWPGRRRSYCEERLKLPSITFAFNTALDSAPYISIQSDTLQYFFKTFNWSWLVQCISTNHDKAFIAWKKKIFSPANLNGKVRPTTEV